MKRFKSFVTEGDVVPFPGKKQPTEPTAKSYIQQMKTSIDTITPHIESIVNEPLDSKVVKDMTPSITNQYRGTDVHPVEQLHQFITYPTEDIHPDPNVGSRMKEHAINIARKHKDTILSHLDDKINRASEVLHGHAQGNKPILVHFEGAGGSIGHLKRIRRDIEKL